MFDEGNMEKKPINRHSPVPVKTNTGDKKTDNARFQRTTRRKENGARSYQDANPNKKPFPQKARAASDKRPRPRGYFNDKQRDEVANEIVAEYNSSVSKKDLNRMINFDYGFHRTSTSTYHGSMPIRPRRNHYKNGYGSGVVFNKQQYLQANCQFVMKDSGDYSIHAIDPDQPVEWDNIEQVCMTTPDLPSCPICLSPPVAGKITKCGHIYCWACILHYLALSEKNWHTCPICSEDVHQKDLKSVKTIEVHRYKIGDTIKLNLMRRDKGNTISVARSNWNGLPSKPFNVKESHLACYSKVVTATPADVQELVTEPETVQLERQLEEAEESEKCFIESALFQQKDRTLLQSLSPTHKVREQQQLSLEIESLTLNEPKKSDTSVCHKTSKYYVNAFDEIAEEPTSGPVDPSDDPCFPLADEEKDDEQKVVCMAAASQGLLTDACGLTDQELMPTEEAAQCLELPHDLGDEEADRKRRPKCSPKNTFYFYQAADGQHIYMHAINARCMVQEYGSLMNCPDAIEATIVELESVTMTEELRKRLRYLSHLPLSAEFKVAEMLLKPPIVSKETLKCFSDEIEKRRRIRQKKSREERSRSRRIQEEENRKYGISPVQIVMSSAAEIKKQTLYPEFSIPLSSYNSPSVTSIDIASPSTSGDSLIASPSSAASSCTSEGNQTTSFAQMLKSGKFRPTVCPGQSAWPSKPDSVVRSHPVRASDSDASDNEDKIPVPNFQNSFGDAIQIALNNLEQNNSGHSAAAAAAASSSSGGGKKKKKMKKLLFTTTMARGK